jgi:hypothetical protein
MGKKLKKGTKASIVTELVVMDAGRARVSASSALRAPAPSKLIPARNLSLIFDLALVDSCML